MALSGSFDTNSYDGRYLKFAWELEHQNNSNRDSVISWRLTGEGTSTNKNYYPVKNIKVIIDDLIIYASSEEIELWEGTVVQSGSYTLTQTSSEAKTFSASVEAGINTISTNCNGNESWTLPLITISSGSTGKGSSLHLSTSSIEIGETITANITSANTSYTHDVEFFISGYGGGSNANFYQKYTGVAVSQDFIIPNTWYKYMVSSESCTAYCKVTTKNGSAKVGDVVTKSFTVKVPSDAVPTVGTIRLNPEAVLISGSSYNYLIKEKNKLTISVYECEASEGSKIKSYKFSGPSVNSIVESMDSTASTSVNSINSFGSLLYKVTVTDARGRVASNTQIIQCYNYQAPYFMNFSTSRDGTTLYYTYKVFFFDVDNKNSAVVNIYVDGKIVDTIEDVISNQSETRTLTLSSDTTHQVYATVTDAIGGYSTSNDNTVFSDTKILNISKEYFGLAFGKMCEQNGFECDWDAQFNRDVNIGGDLVVDEDIHTNNLKVKGNIILGPNSTINYGKIDMDGDFVTSDELPENLSDLINDMDFINSIDAVTITKETITAPYIGTLGLTVGNEIKMGPNAVISWTNLPSNVASEGQIPTNISDLNDDVGLINASTVTVIAQNDIQTGKLHLGGNIYRIVDGTNWWESENYLMLGVNYNKRFQIGSADTDAPYTGAVLYSNGGDINFVTSNRDNVSDITVEDYRMRIRSDGQVIINSLNKTDGVAKGGDLGTYRFMVCGDDGYVYASSTTLSSIADGSLKVTAVFG